MMMADEGGVKAKLFTWASGVGREVQRAAASRARTPSGLLAAKYASPTSWSCTKIRARFGGRLRFFISGSARRSTSDIARWFDAVGMLDPEGYGLTETSRGLVRQPAVKAYRYGTRRLAAARHRGAHRRRRRDPAARRRHHGAATTTTAEATAEAIDAEGWFHTGDIGELDERGFLRITDRKKDLFKTCGGKYVAPAEHRGAFKGLCPYASQFVVLRRRPQLRHRAGHPRPRGDRRLGRPARHGGPGLRRDRHAPTRAARWSRATSTSSTRA